MVGGVVVLLLAGLLLIPDVRYKVKHWLKLAVAEDTGWTRTDVALDNGNYQLQLLSPLFHVDQLFPSMTGPSELYHFHLADDRAPELVWMTGYSTEVRDPENSETLDESYLCHNNLDYAIMDYAKHWNLDNREGVLIPRLATITQGQGSIALPEGFGIPLMSNHDLSTATQVLNLNEPEINRDVRHLIKLDYTIGSETDRELKPLFQQSVSVLVPVDTTQNPADTTSSLVDCSPAMASIAFLKQHNNGQLYTGHWVVPKGRDTLAYNVTEMLALPFNTTLHFASVHVHPYCEALELKDLTTGELVFRSEIQHVEGVTKMSNIEVYSSSTGTMLYTDHEYELICYTNNTSGAEKDMMAVMLLYFHDAELAAKLD